MIEKIFWGVNERRFQKRRLSKKQLLFLYIPFEQGNDSNPSMFILVSIFNQPKIEKEIKPLTA